MMRSTFDPLFQDVRPERRRQAQDDFGRHLVEQRNRMAALVRKWVETDARLGIPIHDRLLGRVKRLDAETRADIASIALLMADQILAAALTVFDRGEGMCADGKCVNYAVVAQIREPGTLSVSEEVDVNRGEPVLAVWKAYAQWLARFAPVELRPRAGTGGLENGRQHEEPPPCSS